MLRTKSVNEPINWKKDGLRILATRSLVRYLRKTRYDVWMPSLAPSEKLRNTNLAQTNWKEFSKRYKAEIRQSEFADKANDRIKNHGQKFTLRLLKKLSIRGNVTIMCHCAADEQFCHRHILKDLIARA